MAKTTITRIAKKNKISGILVLILKVAPAVLNKSLKLLGYIPTGLDDVLRYIVQACWGSSKPVVSV